MLCVFRYTATQFFFLFLAVLHQFLYPADIIFHEFLELHSTFSYLVSEKGFRQKFFFFDGGFTYLATVPHPSSS